MVDVTCGRVYLESVVPDDRIHNKLLSGLVSVGGERGMEEALARMIMTLYSTLLLLP